MRLFKRVWANFRLPLSWSLDARRNEGKYTVSAHYSQNNQREQWRLCACANKQPSLLFYQPIDEVRDYDDAFPFERTKKLNYHACLNDHFQQY